MAYPASAWLAAILTLSAASTAVTAHLQTFEPNVASQARAPQLSRDELASRVERSLPKWSNAVVQVPQSVDWAAKLRPDLVAQILGDRELMAAIRRAPQGARLFRTKGSTLRIDPERGELRYVSTNRTIEPLGTVDPLPSTERTRQSTFHTLSALGLPKAEFSPVDVVTQISSGGSVRAKAPETKAEIYRLATITRIVGGIPVFVSDARLALTPKGEVQRLRVTWPALDVSRNVRMASREQVVARAADVLAEHGISARAEIRASLAYVPTDPNRLRGFVPAVMFTVLEPPTPFIFSVPVVEPPEGDADDRPIG